MQENYALRVEKVSKSFDGVQALQQVDLNVRKGEVHALMGENGAGKSTLMKIITGIHQKDAGEIFIGGNRTDIRDPHTALSLGISMIHQELNPLLNLTVAENILLGREPCFASTSILNRTKQRQLVETLLRETGISLDPGVRMNSLAVAELQLVEIVKAVSYNSGIIIMDEPTSAITGREVSKLFEIIRRLKSKGVAIIYISHKMDEIFEIADTITVFRDGRYVDSKPAKQLTPDSLIRLMVGRDINDLYPKGSGAIGAPVLEVDNFSKKDVFHNVSFRARKGEILGIAGLMGAGRTEIMESVFGLSKHDAGTVKVNKKQVLFNSPADAVRHGLAFIPEDRKLKGLNLKGSVKKNITLSSLYNYCKAGQLIDQGKENRVADGEIKQLDIRASGRNQVAATLSGGNQQKIVLSKWFLTSPEILILDEPTRGIDIGARQEIYRIISQVAEQGKTIILISSEMPELLGLCDRIIVINKGRVTGNYAREEFNPETIMSAAMG